MSTVAISVPDFDSNSQFPLLAAKELGCFDEVGLQVEVQLRTSIRALEALRDDSVDFCVLAPSNCSRSFRSGAE